MAELITAPVPTAIESDWTNLPGIGPNTYSGAGWGDIAKAAALWIGAPYLMGSGTLAGLGSGAAGSGTAGSGAGAAGAGAAGAGAAGAAGTVGAAGAAGAASSGLFSNPQLWMAGLGALGSAYSAEQQKDVAEAIAAGSQVKPWGNTGAMMDELLNDAWQQFKWGNFQFGPDPRIYNAYLDYGRKLGVPTGSFQRIDPDAGYGIEAYQRMLDLISGPAWAGRTQTNPAALAGVQDPWAAGILGGLGGYLGAGGTFGGGGGTAAPTMQAATGPTVMQAYESVVNPYFSYGGF